MGRQQMDLVSFRSSRALRRIGISDNTTLQLHDVFGDKAPGHLLLQLRSMMKTEKDPQTQRQQAGQMSTQYLASTDAVADSLLDTLYAWKIPTTAPTPISLPAEVRGNSHNLILVALVVLDRALTSANNKPEPKEFEPALKNALSLSGQTLGDATWFNGWCGLVWASLLDTLIADLLTKAPS